jgi:hypothetical protein
VIAHAPARSRAPRPKVRRLVTAVLTALLTVPALGLAGAAPAKAAADRTESVTSTGGGGGASSFPIAFQNNARGAFGGNPIQVDRFGFR